MRSRFLIISAVMVTSGGIAAAMAMHLASARRVRAELAVARQEIGAGLVALARERLTRLASERPRDPEVLLELGSCEAARGNSELALEIWGRVPRDSPWAGKAALASAEAAIGRGRIAFAERVLRVATQQPSVELTALRRILIVLLGQQGRLDEARDLIERQWQDRRLLPEGDVLSRLALLRQSMGLDFEPFPLEWNLSQFERGAASASGEDRIALALARANLATRAGRFDQARLELEFCRKHRPNDAAVEKAWLGWSTAAGDLGAASEAIRHLPADAFGAADALDLRAWFARMRGDSVVERKALEEMIRTDPGRTAAIVRLAEMLEQAGDRAGATALRQQKAEVDAARDRYNRLYREDRYSQHIEELARIADRLGRRFEASGFWEIVLAGERQNPEASAALARLGSMDSGNSRPAPDAIRSIVDELDRTSSRKHASSPKRALSLVGVVPLFEDRGADSGLAVFELENGSSSIHQLPEAFCGGVGLLDFDGDGRLDVYCVQGGPFPPASGDSRPGDRLFRNRGKGTFVDVTHAAGIAGMPRGYGHGVSVADYDNDGYPDLFVTRWRSYALYHNRGNGTFEDVTGKTGLAGDRDWPTSSAFADLDNDGDLDLYVCHYAKWDPSNPRNCTDPSGKLRITCDPRLFESLPDHVFRNDSGRFVDVTAEAGIVDHDGRGLGVVAADFDGDGLVDLFVANDSTANFLYHNLGGFRFEEVGHVSGVAANAEGGYQAGMGVACGDLDGDGLPDLAVTNFYGESTSFFHNLGHALFVDHTATIGLLAPSRFVLGFGAAFLDANNDGYLDLMTANGHISDLRPLFPCPMTPQLYLGGKSGNLTDATARAGPVFQQPYVGRGLAVGDLDNDGRLDAVLAAQDDPLVVLKNETGPAPGHFVTFKLEGTRSNRDGVGASVTIAAGNRRQVAWRFGGGSFQSAGDSRLHFGLGASERVESVEVRWPSSAVNRYRDLRAGRGYRLREGDATPGSLVGWVESAPGG
jgi:tetratricopeptide (TPR) repeat protein